MLIHWHKSPGYFWFRVFGGYGVHAKRIPADGYELFRYVANRIGTAAGGGSNG